MRLDLGTRRLVGGVLIFALAAYIASRTQSPLRLPALVGGMILGWVTMKLLITTGLAGPARGGNSLLAASTAIGVANAAFASSALSASDLSAPLLLASGSLAFVAGLVLSLRFSALDRTQI